MVCRINYQPLKAPFFVLLVCLFVCFSSSFLDKSLHLQEAS